MSRYLWRQENGHSRHEPSRRPRAEWPGPLRARPFGFPETVARVTGREPYDAVFFVDRAPDPHMGGAQTYNRALIEACLRLKLRILVVVSGAVFRSLVFRGPDLRGEWPGRRPGARGRGRRLGAGAGSSWRFGGRVRGSAQGLIMPYAPWISLRAMTV